MRHHGFPFLLFPLLTVLAASAYAAPVLNVSGNDFPELVVHQPAVDDTGAPLALACDQIRGKRIDELDPLWKKAVDRIHVDCDDLAREEAGFDMVATVVTGFLKPGTVHFAGIPVAEVRLMDSEMWGDHEYILDRPYAEIREQVKTFVESHCRSRQDDPASLVEDSCKLLETDEGLYLEADSLGGIWMHADPDNPAQTVYAEAWSD